jgi:hypothetical protein
VVAIPQSYLRVEGQTLERVRPGGDGREVSGITGSVCNIELLFPVKSLNNTW